MKAARVRSPTSGIIIEDVAEPEPGPHQIVVRITGSGVCRSDLHIVEGALERTRYPLTLGHEPAGYVHAVGKEVDNFSKGEKVLVYPTQGCGTCRYCIEGKDNLCHRAEAVGFEKDGSHAEYLLVDSGRYLFRLEHLQAAEAAPLSCAGITVYHAIKNHVMGFASPGDYVVVIGAGGLGHIAVQILAGLTATRIIVVDEKDSKLDLMRKLGVNYVVNSKDAGSALRRIGSDRIAAVLDIVGSDETLRLGYESLGTSGHLVVLGAAGGTLRYSGPDAKDRIIGGPIIGSLTDMRETIELAELGIIKMNHHEFPLGMVGDVLNRLKQGDIEGRAIVEP